MRYVYECRVRAARQGPPVRLEIARACTSAGGGAGTRSGDAARRVRRCQPTGRDEYRSKLSSPLPLAFERAAGWGGAGKARRETKSSPHGFDPFLSI